MSSIWYQRDGIPVINEYGELITCDECPCESGCPPTGINITLSAGLDANYCDECKLRPAAGISWKWSDVSIAGSYDVPFAETVTGGDNWHMFSGIINTGGPFGSWDEWDAPIEDCGEFGGQAANRSGTTDSFIIEVKMDLTCANIDYVSIHSPDAPDGAFTDALFFEKDSSFVLNSDGYNELVCDREVATSGGYCTVTT